jgi:fibronectin type 3 domain-containing protein
MNKIKINYKNRKGDKMKKPLLLFWLFLLTAHLLIGSQMFVVSEMFTVSWCSGCPAARSALRQMYEQTDEFPYLIPLIWQGDGSHPSPNFTSRFGLYGGQYVPHCQWGGTIEVVGADYGAYINAYNQLVDLNSPIELELDLTLNGDNELNIDAEAVMTADITTTDNNILFILTYDLTGTLDPDYFASVKSYNQQPFNLVTEGESGVYSHTFTLDPSWNHENLLAVVIVQNLVNGNAPIHQAAVASLTSEDLPAPTGLTAQAGDGIVLLEWNAPDYRQELLGFNLYRDGNLINTELIPETEYTDTDVFNGISYEYYVTAVYDDGESEASNIVEATPEQLILNPPQSLIYTVLSNGDVLLDWEPPEGLEPPDLILLRQHSNSQEMAQIAYQRDLSGYNIYRDTAQINLDPLVSTEYLDEGLLPGTYTYYVTAVYDEGESEPSNSVEVTTTSTESLTNPSLQIELLGNYPNPFNPETRITFSLDRKARVQIHIYNLKGQLVRTLLDRRLDTGYYSVIWNGLDDRNTPVVSGLYFTVLETENSRQAKKIMLLK